MYIRCTGVYYGTEIGMKNFANPDLLVRADFPGGWPGDTVNKFLPGGRNAWENEIFNFTKTLAHFRKQSPAIKTGNILHYVPEEGVYVYFRYNN